MLFKEAEVTSAFLKMGIMGFAGAGKTHTASETAIGLINYMREKGVEYAEKPAFFLDTETGSDWVKPRFEAAGIENYKERLLPGRIELIVLRQLRAPSGRP